MINIKKKFLKMPYWLIILLLFVVVFEIAFDLFEITIGRLLLLTNPVRPKTGRLWDEEKRMRMHTRS